MKIVIINSENLSGYMRLLTYDEVFGVIDGELTCFAILSEDGKEAAGVMTVHIFPEYVRIERIFIYPPFRHRRLASKLLEIIEDRPKDLRLPIIFFSDGGADVSGLFKAAGFYEESCPYSVVYGELGDMAELQVPDKLKQRSRISSISRIPEGLLGEYIRKAPHDELIQFPDIKPNIGRFSDASMACLENGEIKAALLMEDFETHTRITWAHGEQSIFLFVCMAMVKRELEPEYGKEYRIECLCSEEGMEKAYSKLFLHSGLRRMRMYRHD
ncbi:MAG: GNAT family N-acetyltransferase [Lachnospiraceae bacterium]|nr:GNAT family N-acetyltransferase [Lachnospiraceae bacterium]